MRSGNIVYDSPHVQTYPGGGGDKHGIIQWDSSGQSQNGTYADTHKTVILWGLRWISGRPGRLLDLHSIPSDNPYGWSPLEYQGGGVTGVAPFSIDYWLQSYTDAGGTAEGLMAVIEPNHWEPYSWATRDMYHHTILTQAEMNALQGTWIWLWIEITWGRTDGTTPWGSGRIRIGVVGESSPRVDVSPANTHWYGQHMVATWVISYDSTLFDSTAVTDMSAPRIGHTASEALADVPVFSEMWDDFSGITFLGNVGGGEAIPAWLGGSTPPPSNTTDPTVTGTPTVGQTLTAHTGTWSGTAPINFTYQWQRCNSSGASCVDIGGATSSTYLLVTADVGSTIRVRVTGTNVDGSSPDFSAVTSVIGGVSGGSGAPVNTAVPVISGQTLVGQTLTATAGTWTGTTPMTFTYQWRRCDGQGANCIDITAATSSTYVPVTDDVGYRLRVVVTGTN